MYCMYYGTQQRAEQGWHLLAFRYRLERATSTITRPSVAYGAPLHHNIIRPHPPSPLCSMFARTQFQFYYSNDPNNTKQPDATGLQRATTTTFLFCSCEARCHIAKQTSPI